MMFWLVILFVALPWLELALLFRVGAAIGGVATFGLIILTGVIGASLTRLEGARALGNIRTSTARGDVPGAAIVDAVLIFAAGLVLITPGFITDAAGFLLLIPPARAVIRTVLIRQLKKHAVYQVNVHTHRRPSAGRSRQRPNDPDIIDVEGHEVQDEEEQGG